MVMMSSRPATQWNTARADEARNLLLNLAVNDETEHIVVIPRHVLDDLWGAGGDPDARAQANVAAIEKAINRAWNPQRLQKVVGVGHPGRNTQLWLEAADFA